MEILLETERLVLRYFKASDLQSFIEYRNDINVSKYQGWSKIFTKQMAKDFLKSQKEVMFGDTGKWLQIAFEEKETGLHIGDCAFIINNKQAEIGFTLAKSYQGQGFAFEGVSGLLVLLFNKLKLHRIIAITDIDNSGSIKLLERLGFRKEGHNLQSFYDEKTNQWRDEFRFALLRKEWEA